MNDQVDHQYEFKGNLILDTTTPAGDGWIQTKTGAHAPSVTAVDGNLEVGLSADSEEQINAAHFGQQPFRLEDVLELRLEMAAEEFGSGVSAVVGLVTGQDDDQENLVGIFWTINAANAVSLACVDGYSVDTSTASGVTLDTTMREFVLDCHTGCVRKDPRVGGSTGGFSDVRAAVDNDAGYLRAVCRSAPQDIQALVDVSPRVELLVQVQKASGTGTGKVLLRRATVSVRNVQGS